jgi:hypothetical protein
MIIRSSAAYGQKLTRVNTVMTRQGQKNSPKKKRRTSDGEAASETTNEAPTFPFRNFSEEITSQIPEIITIRSRVKVKTTIGMISYSKAPILLGLAAAALILDGKLSSEVSFALHCTQVLFISVFIRSFRIKPTPSNNKRSPSLSSSGI